MSAPAPKGVSALRELIGFDRAIGARDWLDRPTPRRVISDAREGLVAILDRIGKADDQRLLECA